MIKSDRCVNASVVHFDLLDKVEASILGASLVVLTGSSGSVCLGHR